MHEIELQLKSQFSAQQRQHEILSNQQALQRERDLLQQMEDEKTHIIKEWQSKVHEVEHRLALALHSQSSHSDGHF